MAKFDRLRRKAEGRKKHRGAFSYEFVAISRYQNANLSRRDKSRALARTHGNLAMKDIAQQLCRLFGPMGACGKQDVVFVDDNGAGGSP